MSEVSARCQGKQHCVVNDLDLYLTNPLNSWYDSCRREDAIVFVQVGCMMNQDALHKRKIAALVFGCLGVFIALFFINYNDYMRKLSENGYIEWDF